jgi:hypothetical protein
MMKKPYKVLKKPLPLYYALDKLLDRFGMDPMEFLAVYPS